MNSESVDCRKVGTNAIERVGDFTFDDELEHIYIWIPGASGPDAIQIRHGEQGSERVWGWDGSVLMPTLTPSLKTPEWHGWLRAGRLVSC